MALQLLLIKLDVIGRCMRMQQWFVGQRIDRLLTGSHLHFEKRVNHVAKDPMEDINNLLPDGVKRKDIIIQGKKHNVKYTMIDEEHYVNFRDAADALGLAVDYDAATQTPIMK